MVSAALAQSLFDDFEIEVSLEAAATTLVPGPVDCVRSARRVPLLLGSIAYLSNERILITRGANISLGGAFISTGNPDPIGTTAALRVDHRGVAMELDVEVVRVSYVSQPDGSGLGMGLRFVGLDDAQRQFLAAYIDDNWARGNA